MTVNALKLWIQPCAYPLYDVVGHLLAPRVSGLISYLQSNDQHEP